MVLLGLTDRAERGDEWARRTWKGVGADGIGAEVVVTLRLIAVDVSDSCQIICRPEGVVVVDSWCTSTKLIFCKINQLPTFNFNFPFISSFSPPSEMPIPTHTGPEPSVFPSLTIAQIDAARTSAWYHIFEDLTIPSIIINLKELGEKDLFLQVSPIHLCLRIHMN
jgi:hypothetical protein